MKGSGIVNKFHPLDQDVIIDKSEIWKNYIVPLLFKVGFRGVGKNYYKDIVMIQKSERYIIAAIGNKIEYLPYNKYSVLGFLHFNKLL